MIQRNTGVHAGQPDQEPQQNSGPELLQGVLEAVPLGMALFALTPAGPTFKAGNREFNRIVRPEFPPVEGAPLEEVFTRADGGAIRQLFEQVRQRREPQSHFAPIQSGPPTDQLWNIDAYPVVSRGKVSHIMVLTEQTEEKLEARQRQQQETNRLRERADQLAELEAAKSEFLRLASHELRGPAAMLGGYLSMMEDEALGPIPERMRPVLPLLRAKASQINMLANEMVEAARLEDRRLQLKRKRVDLRELARRSINGAAAGVSEKHQLRFEDHVGAPVMVQADVMRMEIIIGNLIDNAIKYSPDGGEIGVHLSVMKDMAQVVIRDGGIGIAPQDMERLFIRFNRIAPRPDVPGTGLGLYLARELARLHGGDIVAVSRLGEGSEFTLSLPLDQTS